MQSNSDRVRDGPGQAAFWSWAWHRALLVALVVSITLGVASMQTSRAANAAALHGAVAAAQHRGFATAVSENWHYYTFRLVASAGIAAYRAPVEAVLRQLNTTKYVSAVLAPGYLKAVPSTPARGTIYLRTATTSPCGGIAQGVAGCGSASSYVLPDGTSIAYGGNVWFMTASSSYSLAARRHLAAHEIGHALGLDHYSSTFKGRTQIMDPSSYAADAYQSGDLAGLRYLDKARRPATGRIRASTTGATLTVTGNAEDPDVEGVFAPKIRVTLDGRKISVKPQAGSDKFTWNAVRPVGQHRVCLYVTDLQSSREGSGKCATVTIAGG